MTAQPDGVPYTLLYNLRHNQVLHERVILMTVVMTEVPRVAPNDRVAIEPLAEGFYRVILSYGFKDDPNIPLALELCGQHGMAPVEMMETSFFLGRETIVPNRVPSMPLWRQLLFRWMFSSLT